MAILNWFHIETRITFLLTKEKIISFDTQWMKKNFWTRTLIWNQNFGKNLPSEE